MNYIKVVNVEKIKNYIIYGFLKDHDKRIFSINDVLKMIDDYTEIIDSYENNQ